MSLPPDRGHVATEARHERSVALDALDVPGCVDLIIDDHGGVADAAARLPPETLESLLELLEGTPGERRRR